MTDQLTLALQSGPADLAARLRLFGLPPAMPITLHENRRVMVSLDRRGGLRVHRGFAFAPDPIVAALAKWAKPRLRRVDRREAARTFLRFPIHLHLPPTPSARRRSDAPLDPIDVARVSRLRSLHQSLNLQWFDGSLATVRIALSTRMRRKLGHYEPRSEGEPAIVIARRHLTRDGWLAVADTVLHEMVHQWQDENGLRVDHGPTFRRKALEVGIEPSAVVVRR
jgi:hypothetical protein